MRLTREYLIEKQGADLPGYFIMVQIPNPEPIEITRTFDQAHLIEGDWMNMTLKLIKIQLIDVEEYDLAPQQHFQPKDQKIPVCIKR